MSSLVRVSSETMTKYVVYCKKNQRSIQNSIDSAISFAVDNDFAKPKGAKPVKPAPTKKETTWQ